MEKEAENHGVLLTTFRYLASSPRTHCVEERVKFLVRRIGARGHVFMNGRSAKSHHVVANRLLKESEAAEDIAACCSFFWRSNS